MPPNDRLVILCTGDLHLGRYPSRVPPGRADLSVASVWARVVDLAIERRVDLVALTGDIVDRANRFYEALGPLEAGIRRLAAHKIKTYAVAGNHDFDVLPQLVDAVGAEHFRLLGAGGRWEEAVFFRGECARLRLAGWSFPTQYITRSPLEGFEALYEGEGAGFDVPMVALLHADLDQAGSRYAPVSRAELSAQPVSAWLLGHIHRPTALRGAGQELILYPGSTQALDPGERGVRGPWLVEIAEDGRAEAAQVALATTHYQRVELDLSELKERADLDAWVSGQIRQRALDIIEAARSGEGGRAPNYLSVRLALSGRTYFQRELEPLSRKIVEEFSLLIEQTQVVVERVELNTQPAIDLVDVAKGSDPPGVLAQLLLALQRDDLPGEYQELFEKLAEKLERFRGSRAFSPLISQGIARPKVSEDELKRYIKQEGFRLLEELLSQQENAPPPRALEDVKSPEIGAEVPS